MRATKAVKRLLSKQPSHPKRPQQDLLQINVRWGEAEHSVKSHCIAPTLQFKSKGTRKTILQMLNVCQAADAKPSACPPFSLAPSARQSSQRSPNRQANVHKKVSKRSVMAEQATSALMGY